MSEPRRERSKMRHYNADASVSLGEYASRIVDYLDKKTGKSHRANRKLQVHDYSGIMSEEIRLFQRRKFYGLPMPSRKVGTLMRWITGPIPRLTPQSKIGVKINYGFITSNELEEILSRVE